MSELDEGRELGASPDKIAAQALSLLYPTLFALTCVGKMESCPKSRSSSSLLTAWSSGRVTGSAASTQWRIRKSAWALWAACTSFCVEGKHHRMSWSGTDRPRNPKDNALRNHLLRLTLIVEGSFATRRGASSAKSEGFVFARARMAL
jgi:hypothetical protein